MLYSVLTWSFFFSFHHAKATHISIKNAGFESTTGFTKIPMPNNTYYYQKDVIVDDWTLYDQNGIAKDWALGVINPTDGNSFDDAIFSDTVPEGLICGYVEQGDNKKQGDGELGIEQTLSEVVSPHTTYTLTVWVGNPSNNCFSTESTDSKDICFKDRTGFPGYRVQLLAGSNIVSEDDDTLSVGEGQWTLSTVTYAASDMHIGDILGIRLINKNAADGVEIAFDAVQLDAVTTTTSTASATTGTTLAATSSNTILSTITTTFTITTLTSSAPNPVTSSTKIIHGPALVASIVVGALLYCVCIYIVCTRAKLWKVDEKEMSDVIEEKKKNIDAFETTRGGEDDGALDDVPAPPPPRPPSEIKEYEAVMIQNETRGIQKIEATSSETEDPVESESNEENVRM